jgi:hypothetical protein
MEQKTRKIKEDCEKEKREMREALDKEMRNYMKEFTSVASQLQSENGEFRSRMHELETKYGLVKEAKGRRKSRKIVGLVKEAKGET